MYIELPDNELIPMDTLINICLHKPDIYNENYRIVFSMLEEYDHWIESSDSKYIDSVFKEISDYIAWENKKLLILKKEKKNVD